MGSIFGGGASPILVYFAGGWDVHWGYDLAFDLATSMPAIFRVDPQARGAESASSALPATNSSWRLGLREALFAIFGLRVVMGLGVRLRVTQVSPGFVGFGCWGVTGLAAGGQGKSKLGRNFRGGFTYKLGNRDPVEAELSIPKILAVASFPFV